MPRRTAEANKAILIAWNKEQELVSEGKGTRDWTPEQQKDILEKGKAYDDEGFAFQGQHMKSAERYPECQGNPENIQFLTRAEHLEAHDGSWRNPTNWYFDPITKEKTDFGDGPIIPCKVIPLSEAIIISNSITENTESEIREKIDVAEKESQQKPNENGKKVQVINKSGVDINRSLRNTMKSCYKATKEFSVRHPVLARISKVIIAIGGTVIVSTIASNSRNSSAHHNFRNDSGVSSDGEYDFADNALENESYDDLIDEEELNDNREKRPYTPNDVPAGGQHYHTKDGLKWIEKAGYHRGGSEDG